jgi:hypothetical protein
LKRLCARDVGIENTDHFQPDVIDFQHLTESGIVAEEILADGGANDRYLRVRLLVERIEGAPFRELHAAELEVMVGDAERHRVRPRRRAHHLVRFQADSRGYPFDSRDRLPNRIDVAAGEPRRFLSNLHQVFASEVLGIHDDVAQPETLDHLERLSLCAFTDREHRDHRTDPRATCVPSGCRWRRGTSRRSSRESAIRVGRRRRRGHSARLSRVAQRDGVPIRDAPFEDDAS